MTILQHLTKEAELSNEEKYILGRALRGTAGGSLAGGVIGGKKGVLPGALLGGAFSTGGALVKRYRKNKKEEKEEDK